MRYLGIDFGDKHVGVSISDENGILAGKIVIQGGLGDLAPFSDLLHGGAFVPVLVEENFTAIQYEIAHKRFFVFCQCYLQ